MGEVWPGFLRPAEVQDALADLLAPEAAFGLPCCGRLRCEALLDGERLGWAAERANAAGSAPLGDADLLGLPLLSSCGERGFERRQRSVEVAGIEARPADVVPEAA